MADAWTPTHAAGSAAAAEPAVRRIEVADVFDALRLGWQDFQAAPTQLVFLGLIYPLVGLFAARATSGGAARRLAGSLLAWADATAAASRGLRGAARLPGCPRPREAFGIVQRRREGVAMGVSRCGVGLGSWAWAR